MKRKTLIIIGILLLLFVAAYFYFDNRNRTLSPPASVSHFNGELSAKIDYSRPSVRNRLVFGEGEDALQPFGKYWRLGANESTELQISNDVLFNGKELKAGRYKIYAIPGKNQFEIFVNTELGKWGAFEPDKELDLFSVQSKVNRLSEAVEQYTISMKNEADGIRVLFEFSDYSFYVDLQPMND